MAFKSYLDYDEYVKLGGKVSEDAFPVLERQAQRWIDVFTFNRIPKLTSVPDVVKDVLVSFIEKLSEYQTATADAKLLASYSNGTEKLEYRKPYDSELKRELGLYAYAWLPEYLTNRSVMFDVTRDLQSDNNNP